MIQLNGILQDNKVINEEVNALITEGDFEKY